MLDDDSTPTTETTSTSRTRRRAAGRPAGPPAPVSTDIFAPPPATAKKAAKAAKPAADDAAGPDAESAPVVKVAKRTTTKAASRSAGPADPDAKAAAEPTAAADEGSEPAAPRKRSAKKASTPKADPETPQDAAPGADDTDGQGAEEQAPARPARKRGGRSGRPAGEPAAVVPAFQAPEAVDVPARAVDDEPADEATDDSSDGSADEGEGSGSSGPKRRRRSRGGRRRNNKGDGGSDDTTPEGSSDEHDDADGDDVDGQGGGTRRRRRRARAGENASTSPDDPENTVVRVREGRNPEDEITGVSGSTRLEAKKQRRREGREAGRRRAPIVSEAEFLARRESVERTMVVRQHQGTGPNAQQDTYTQIAVLEDSVLVEHYVARESQTSLIGNVYLGKVQNVLPSMEAAFVDIGAGRNAVIYAGEVDWSGIQNGKARKIEEALSPGQQILVQVTKDPIGQKGARLTSQISLPGRFLVYVPGGQSNGISRKLPDTERNRLKSLLKEVLPEDAGVIVRTAAEGATEDQLTRDVTALTARWDDIKVKAGIGEDSSTPTAKAPQLLYAEPDLVIKVVRDLFNEDFGALVVEGSDAWDNISGYISHVAPDLAERLQEWAPAENDGRDSFDVMRIDEQIHKALDRKVWLPSGGSLVIDRTEAMTVVDVNTGKFTGSGGNLEETVTKNNLEAAEEIVRQLRLRDIGGIIVIDFIDMVLESNRDLVLRRLVECLGRDRTRHQVAEVTSLGLVQMTRKRIGTGLLESFSTECEHCDGRGVVITAEPVEPKKDEPRGRQRRGRGGNANGGNGGGNNGGNAGNGGGGNNGGGNNGGGNNGGGEGGRSRRGGQKADAEKTAEPESSADPAKDDAPSSTPAEASEPEQETPAPAVDAALENGPTTTLDAGAEAEADATPAEAGQAPDGEATTDPSTGTPPEDAPVLTEPGDGP